MTEDVQVSMDDIKADLDKVRKDNAQLATELRQNGAQLDSGGVTMLRLNALLDIIMDEDQKLAFELKFEQLVRKTLLEIVEQVKEVRAQQEAQARQHKLLQGIHVNTPMGNGPLGQRGIIPGK